MAEFKQDMPPPNGYARILYQRSFAKTFLNWKILLGGTIVVHTWALYRYKYHGKRRMGMLMEENDVKIALEPFLLAERDRLWLETLSRMRDEENEVMKDVPGWKAGTWYGEPMYFTIQPDKWWDPTSREVMAQTRRTDLFQHAWFNRLEFGGAPHWFDKFLPQFVLDWQKA